MQVFLRYLREEDLPSVFEIEKEVFKERAWTIEMIKGEWIQPNSIGLLLLNNLQSIGYLLARIYIDEAEILRLAIKPDYQGKGLGKLLWRGFLKEANLREIKKIFLEVSDKNIKAQNFYKKIGFYKMGMRKNYYGGGENALMLEFKIKRDKEKDYSAWHMK